MSASPKSATATSLLQLLDEEMQRLAKFLPPALWEQALIGPAREFLQRPGKQFRARLVDAGWSLAGGAPAGAPLELVLAVELIHAGALIVDDVQDSAVTRRGSPALHRLVGVPLALNTGGWLYFLPFSLVDRAGFDAEVEIAIQRRMQQTMLICHEGQALDLAWRVTELAQCDVASVVAETTARKTAALTEAAAALGALAARGSASSVQGLGMFGHELGVGLQMFDDLGGLTDPDRAEKAAEDLGGARPTWPWAWAAETCDPASYQELVRQARLVAAGASHEPLARRLAERVAPLGEMRARARLQQSFACLRASSVNAATVAEIERDFQCLAESYGL
jgi:geranylgeranyl pyrophosphate synthase